MCARDLFKESCAIFCEGTLPWATAPLKDISHTSSKCGHTHKPHPHCVINYDVIVKKTTQKTIHVIIVHLVGPEPLTAKYVAFLH